MVWVCRAQRRLMGDKTSVRPPQILTWHEPPWSKLIQNFLHQTFQGLQTAWAWKAMVRNKTTQPFSATNTSFLLRTRHPNCSSCNSFPRTGLSNWSDWKAGWFPCRHHDSFPKTTGIPSSSLSQGQVTGQVYPKTLTALAMSSSEMTYFPELFCVSRA